MKRRRRNDPVLRSKVSFDATLRERGSFSGCGDRTFGQVFRGNGDLTLPELRWKQGPRADC